MKKQLLHLTALLMLATFSLNLFSIAGDDKKSSCPMDEEMTCCAMDEMEMSDCECPEMTRQDRPQKENLPPVPLTIITKQITGPEFITINYFDDPSFSQLDYASHQAVNSAQSKLKIYKKTNTFLI